MTLTTPPNNTSPPTFTGTARQGEVLTRASWGSPTPTRYHLEWLRCNASGTSCGEIPAASADAPLPTIVIAGTLSPGRTVFRQVVRGCLPTAQLPHAPPQAQDSRARAHPRDGTVIQRRVVKRGRVGKYTRIRIRRRRGRACVDRCLNPGSYRPRRCR